MTSVETGLNRAILRLAVPALGALAIDPLLTLIDTVFVARLGVTELAALGVDTAILGIAFFGFNFLAYATTPLVARALGRGDTALARRLAGDAVTLAVALGVAAAALLLWLAPLAVDLMGSAADFRAPAITYLRIRALATPALLVATAGHGVFRGNQDTRTPLVVVAVVNGLNVVLDPLLIFALGWGLSGAAIATVVAQYLGAIWFVDLLWRRSLAARPTGLRASVPTLVELGRNGILVAIRSAFLLVAFTYAAAKATRIGSTSIAAHQVVMQIWLLSAMIVDSLAIAGQAMIGDAAGASDRVRVDRVSARLVILGLATGVVLALFLAYGDVVFSGLIEDPEVLVLALSAAAVAGLMMPIAGPLFVADGIFLGFLALRVIIVSTGLGAMVAIGLLALSPLGSTLEGIWWAISAMIVVRSVVFAVSYGRAASTAVRS